CRTPTELPELLQRFTGQKIVDHGELRRAVLPLRGYGAAGGVLVDGAAREAAALLHVEEGGRLGQGGIALAQRVALLAVVSLLVRRIGPLVIAPGSAVGLRDIAAEILNAVTEPPLVEENG